MGKYRKHDISLEWARAVRHEIRKVEDGKLCRLMDERAKKIRAELDSLKGPVKKVNGKWREEDGH